MPRTARIVLPNYPHHVVHRGHNRQQVFTTEEDYRFYLSRLAGLAAEFSCRIHAYCLMPNHVHLILNPGEAGENLSLMMKKLACLHTRRFNKVNERSGTLWEGRFRSSPIQEERYLLACCRYIDLNPQRAKIVSRPEEYRWSSCRIKVGLERSRWLYMDSTFIRLGPNHEERCRKYKDLIDAGLSGEDGKMIRRAVSRGGMTAQASVIELKSRDLKRYAGPRDPGRPRKGVRPTCEKGDGKRCLSRL